MLNNPKGSVTVIALIIMVFATIVLSGVVPMVTNQLNMTTRNQDFIEAQLVAEAGAKRAIVAIANGRTDWNWINNDTHNLFTGNEADGFFTVTVDPQININTTPAANTLYTITSVGHVGNSRKTVSVTVTTASQAQDSIFSKYAIFSNGTLNINSGSTKINDDIASNKEINLNWSSPGTVNGYAYAPKDKVNRGHPTVVTGIEILAKSEDKIDINSLTPSMISYSKTGADISKVQTNNLTESTYYCDGDYAVNGHNFVIPDGKSVTIYIKGKFDVYSGNSIKGGNITIYAGNGMYLSGGSIQAGTNGTVKLYTPGELKVNSNSSIDGKHVTIIAQTRVTLDGGTINKTLSGAITEIYTKDFTLGNSASTISGNGFGLVVASNNIYLSGGTAPTTLMIAGNYIQENNSGVTVAGLYSNGTIDITGGNVTHNDSIAGMFNLGGSGTTTDLVVGAWSN